jgi:superoxide dismutase, Fe-Mn family
MEYRVSPLPYPCSALEPYLDAETMLIHHEHYYASYARDLNRILRIHPELHGNSVQDLVVHLAGVPESIREAVRNYAGGCLNHEVFFSLLRPRQNRGPEGSLAEAIHGSFHDLETFRHKFEEAALNLFGSGWVWLVSSLHTGLTASGSRLRILTTHDHGNPFSLGLFPILGIDLWEHAYHHRYRNDRQAYLAAWWRVLDWEAVEQRYQLVKTATPRKQPQLLPPVLDTLRDLPVFHTIA